MLKFSKVKNFSNYVSKVDDIDSGLEYVLERLDDSVFGVEWLITSRGVESYILTPPHIRLDSPGKINKNLSSTLDSSRLHFSGYLRQPFFMPIYKGLDGLFVEWVRELPISLQKDEAIYIQWLFCKVAHWQETALDMFSSWLQGNDYPFTSNPARKVQDKVIQSIGRLASFQAERPYIQEVEEKILSEAYRFQLRTVMQTESENTIRRCKAILQEYDSYNSIQLKENKDKDFIQNMNERILTADSSHQIISRGELVSLFGGEEPVEAEISHSESFEELGKETPTDNYKTPGRYLNEAYSLLPAIESTQAEANPHIITDIADAMKRVNLLKSARVFNEEVTAGVRLTVAQFSIPKGKTITQIQNKQKDIQAALGVPSLAVEQGDLPDTVRFVIPNEESAIISLRGLVDREEFKKFSEENPLAFAVGVDEVNNPIYLSLVKLVHLLVAGTTGSGKSVFLNSLITTLALGNDPSRLQMIMIDPKDVELQHFEGFPHVQEVITDMNQAKRALDELVNMMNMRYALLKGAGVKNIATYNKKMSQDPLPYVVCIIDEYADLKDTNPEVEDCIARLGQKARAAGIHLVIATQRPDATVISGRVKAVIPNAISFNLNNNTNYKTVFGKGIGNITLLGRGDGLMKIEGYPKELQRFQSAIITPDETQEGQIFKDIERYLKGGETSKNLSSSLEKPQTLSSTPDSDRLDLGTHTDQMYQLKQLIAKTRETRVSVLREQLNIRAATLTDLMNQLVEEGWLIKHESKAKGYELVASEDILSEWG